MATAYLMTVIRREDNPEFDAARAARAAESRQRGPMYYSEREDYTVSPTKDVRVLDVALEEDEYAAVKRAVMELWR